MTRLPIPTSRALAAAAMASWAIVAVAADAPRAAAAPAQGAASTPANTTPRTASVQSAPTRQALETLLGTLPVQQAQGAAPPRQQTTARRGETVDAAIRRTMGDMPFKENFLRGVFLELNAAALQPGTTRLIAGAPLLVPHLEDLRSHLQRVLGPQQVAAPHGAAPTAPAAPDRRHWVRFP